MPAVKGSDGVKRLEINYSVRYIHCFSSSATKGNVSPSKKKNWKGLHAEVSPRNKS